MAQKAKKKQKNAQELFSFDAAESFRRQLMQDRKSRGEKLSAIPKKGWLRMVAVAAAGGAGLVFVSKKMKKAA